jgi:hypothetical protein
MLNILPLQLLTHKTCQDKLSWVAFHHRPLVKIPGDRLMGDIFNSSTKYKGEDLMLSLFNDAYICLASNIVLCVNNCKGNILPADLALV